MSVTNKFSSKSDSIEQIARGLKALDNSQTRRAIMVRDMAMRLLFITYIVYVLFELGDFVIAALVGFGVTYFMSQAYILITFQKDAKYSLGEWYFLYQNQGRLSKLFLYLGILLVVALLGETIFFITTTESTWLNLSREDLLRNAFLSLFILSSFISSLLDKLSTTIMKKTVKNKTMGVSEPTIEDEERKYHKLAKDVLENNSTDSTQKKSIDYSKMDVTAGTQDETKSNRRQQQLIQSAQQKLESIGSDTSDFAFGPEELDVLTEEELNALLPEGTSSESFSYNWEIREK